MSHEFSDVADLPIAMVQELPQPGYRQYIRMSPGVRATAAGVVTVGIAFGGAACSVESPTPHPTAIVDSTGPREPMPGQAPTGLTPFLNIGDLRNAVTLTQLPGCEVGVAGSGALLRDPEDCASIPPMDRDTYKAPGYDVELPGNCGGYLMGYLQVTEAGEVQAHAEGMSPEYQLGLAELTNNPLISDLMRTHINAGGTVSFWLNSNPENGYYQGRDDKGQFGDAVQFCFQFAQDRAASASKDPTYEPTYVTYADILRVGMHELGHAAYGDWREAGKSDTRLAGLLAELDQSCLAELRWAGEQARTQLIADPHTAEVLASVRDSGFTTTENGRRVAQYVLDAFSRPGGLDDLVGYIDGADGCVSSDVHAQYLNEVDMFALAAQKLGITNFNEDGELAYPADLATLSGKYEATVAGSFGYIQENHVLSFLGSGGHAQDRLTEAVASTVPSWTLAPTRTLADINALSPVQRQLIKAKYNALSKVVDYYYAKYAPSSNVPSMLNLHGLVSGVRG